jgi:glycine hydroxymethyltransferase
MSQVSEQAINAGLASADPEISRLIDQERHRQETHLELIA